jgi:4,5-dihydroxyphthalate decarboxylase
MALKLAMTCGPYDRAQSLINGTVKPDGIDLEVVINPDPGRDTKIDGREFDAAEFYSGLYIADLHYKTMGYTALPIFVKRMFRHSYIYINKRAGIRSPADLNGKRIGIQNWMTTTAVWQGACSKTNTGSISNPSHGFPNAIALWATGSRRLG